MLYCFLLMVNKMKIILKLLITAFIFCAFIPGFSAAKHLNHISSRIFSTNDLNLIEELLEDSDKDTLVLFDVDQTLITPNDSILKPRWEKHLDQLLGGKKYFIDNFGKTRYIFREILISAPHSVIDQKSLSLVQKLQKKEIPTIAFTAAPGGKIGKITSFIDWRVDELKKFGFDFSLAFPDTKTLKLSKDNNKEFPPIYKSGVLITSLHDKGFVLTNFLKEINWTPKKIIFIDDKMHNIKSVIQALEDKIQVYGVHYTKADDFPCDLDKQIAKNQVDYFIENGVWISDFQVD
jgi:Protein of unknown function (DUF2608)